MISKKPSVQDRVMQAVRRSIYSGELKPGEPLLEMGLARKHLVSQATVREALVKLEHTGLVRRVRNQGTFVTELSLEELREHLRLRVVLECIAAVEAAPRMRDKDFDELRVYGDRLSKAMAKNAPYEMSQCDLEFHRLIWKLSGDKTLCRILEQLSVPLFAYLSIRRSRGYENMQNVREPHEPIIEALQSGVAETIREAIRSHIESSYCQYLNVGADITRDSGSEVEMARF